MVVLNHSRNRTTGVTTPLMTLHVAAHRERLSTARVGATEGLLARVAVGVDTQAGGPRESLVAGAADVAVMVLLVRGRVGGREVVVVLPGRSDRRDHLLVCLRWRCCWSRCCCWCGSRWSLVVDGGCGGSSRRGGGGSSSSRSSGFNGRSVRSHARSGRSVRTSGRDRLSNGSLAGDRGTVRGESHLVVLLVVLVAGGRHRRSRGRVAAGAVEAGTRAQWRRGRQADRNTGHDRFIGTRLRTRVRRADSLALCWIYC